MGPPLGYFSKLKDSNAVHTFISAHPLRTKKSTVMFRIQLGTDKEPIPCVTLIWVQQEDVLLNVVQNIDLLIVCVLFLRNIAVHQILWRFPGWRNGVLDFTIFNIMLFRIYRLNKNVCEIVLYKMLCQKFYC